MYFTLVLNAVNSLVSGHSQEVEKVAIGRAVHFQELFPEEKKGIKNVVRKWSCPLTSVTSAC